MSEMQEQALKKLREEDKAAKFDRYGNAVHKEVREALEEFIRQDEEFAQAVVQGGQFGACIQQVIQGVTGSISDLEAYRRAVRFYFPGANVRFQMMIDLIGEAGDAATTSSTASGPPSPSLGKAESGIALDLSAFL